MQRIIDSRGNGKTNRLMTLAKENNGILVCANPQAMTAKAHAYGLTGFDIVSYYDYSVHNYEFDKPVYIDELENYVKSLNKRFDGYSLTNED
jgi:hypothetical protein